MDETDEKLIAALRHNARAAVSDLAVDLNMSRTTVRARIAKLQARGDIVGFSVVIRADVAQDPVRGMMMIEIAGRGAEKIIRQLGVMSEVRAVHSTNGRWDVIVEIGTRTLEQFDAVLVRVRKLEGIVSSETSLFLTTRKMG